MTGILNILAGSISSAIKDGYFNLVSLLLPGNGTNGAQNNTFLDSSSNNFTITRNGNTTQGTFSPFSQTGWSNYFGGSYLETTATQIIPATGDFTIEAFVYVASLSTNPVIVSQGTTGTAGRTIFYITTAGNLYFFSNAVTAQSTGTITANSWNYVAVTRTGSSLAFYINGSASGTATVSSTVQNTVLRIGRYWNSDQDLTGYISNLRISNTVRAISSTPTSSFTSDANTILLTCQSNRFVDASSNAYALTPTNSPSVQPFSPFAPTAAYSAATNGGSGYFDGSGDYLTVADNDALDLTGDFTIECWVYPTNVSPGYNSNMISRWAASGGTIYNMQIQNGGTFRFVTSANAYTGGSITPNTWTHVAATRSGTSLRLFRNGVLESTNTDSTSFSGTQVTSIGAEGDGASAFPGYICGARIVKGTAVYTAAFTPPTAPPTNITNTSLLANFTNAGITDATAKNDLETVGNAQISTTQSKFGGSSMYFDGTGDYLYEPNNINYDFGSGDFTIEFWMYTAQTGAAGLLSKRSDGGASNTNWLITLDTAAIKFYASDGSTYQINAIGGGTVNNSAWHHVAITRSGSSFKVFVDGTQVGSTGTWSGTISSTSRPFYVAVDDRATGNAYYNGYIDDLRITKGYARYTANFTPPTAAFPLQ